MRNIDKIKQMNVDEITKFIIYSECHCVFDGSDCIGKDCESGIKQWLLTECE